MLDVGAAEMRAANPAFRVSQPTPKSIVLEPKAHTGQYRCLSCAKVYEFTKNYQDPKQKYTKPHCPYCDSGKALAITPLAAVQTTEPEGGNSKKAKLARFVRRNFKAHCELKTYFETFENMISRAALPRDLEHRLKTRMLALQEQILVEVESVANHRLQERLRSMGIASGEDVF